MYGSTISRWIVHMLMLNRKEHRNVNHPVKKYHYICNTIQLPSCIMINISSDYYCHSMLD